MFLSQIRCRQAGIINANNRYSPGAAWRWIHQRPSTRDAQTSSATSYSTIPDPYRARKLRGEVSPAHRRWIDVSSAGSYHRIAGSQRGDVVASIQRDHPRRRDALIYGHVSPCSNTGNKDTVGFSRIYALTIQNGERLPGFNLVRILP